MRKQVSRSWAQGHSDTSSSFNILSQARPEALTVIVLAAASVLEQTEI